MPTSPSSAVPITLLAGPQLLGMLFAWCLQGVLSIQVYIYYTWFRSDPLGTKLLVYGLFIFEWVQIGLFTEFTFDNYVYGYGQVETLTSFNNTWFSIVVMTAIISAVVQGFFAWRIRILGKSAILPAVIVTFSFCQMSLGVAGGVMLHVISPSAAEASAATPVLSTWLACATFVDLIIAVSMSVLLLRAKSGLKKTDDKVNRLVRFAVETGAVTASVAILEIIFFAGFSETLLYQSMAPVLAKLYSNTLIASLNNRIVLKVATGDSVPNIQLSTLGNIAVGGRWQRSTGEESSHTFRHGVHVSVSEERYVSRNADVLKNGEQKGRSSLIPTPV